MITSWRCPSLDPEALDVEALQICQVEYTENGPPTTGDRYLWPGKPLALVELRVGQLVGSTWLAGGACRSGNETSRAAHSGLEDAH